MRHAWQGRRVNVGRELSNGRYRCQKQDGRRCRPQLALLDRLGSLIERHLWLFLSGFEDWQHDVPNRLAGARDCAHQRVFTACGCDVGQTACDAPVVASLRRSARSLLIDKRWNPKKIGTKNAGKSASG